MGWEYLIHQKAIAIKAIDILRNYAMVYLSMEERTGKTGTVLEISNLIKPSNFLVITKKRAIDGWIEHLENLEHSSKFTITNYEAVHKLNPNDYDAIVLDEAHSNLSMYPKVGKRWKIIKEFTEGKIIIYLSATPSAQSLSQLYHQFALSDWSPWKEYTSFYRWHKKFGVPKQQFIAGRSIIKYNETHNDMIMDTVKHLFISYTREEIGFEVEPIDEVHYVELPLELQELQKLMAKDRFIDGGHPLLKNEFDYILDSPMKYRTGMHQLEGGTVKINDDEVIFLPSMFHTKVHYILGKWGDTEDMVIFYQYKAEKILLEKMFTNARVLQGTSFAEGVDLHKYKTLIVYSMDFSTAKYSQRRARQANIKRVDDIVVHYLLVKKGISEEVYTTVAINKENYVDRYFIPDY